jgi:hypothetical protein
MESQALLPPQENPDIPFSYKIILKFHKYPFVSLFMFSMEVLSLIMCTEASGNVIKSSADTAY